MKLFATAAICLQASTALAVPTLLARDAHHDSVTLQGGMVAGEKSAGGQPLENFDVVEGGDAVEVVEPPAAGGEGAGAGDGAGAGEGEEGAVENEVEIEALFGDTVALEGGDLKQDVLYPPNLNGVFEVEFQNAEARSLVVTENPAPAAAPAGFEHFEDVTWIVEVAEGTEGLTLQKIDYILNAESTLDISKGQIGRFCAEANTFVIDPAIGELEFELEENELTLTVDNMNGEWGVFLPTAAGAEEGAGAGAGEAGAGAGAALLDAMMAFFKEAGGAA